LKKIKKKYLNGLCRLSRATIFASVAYDKGFSFLCSRREGSVFWLLGFPFYARAHKDFDDSDYHSLREIRNSLTHRFLKIKKAPLKENIKNITKKHSLYKQ